MIANIIAALNLTVTSKEAIRQALISKGADIPLSMPFRQYVTALEGLVCGGGSDFFGDGSGKAYSSFNGTTDGILSPSVGLTAYKNTPFGKGLYFSGGDLYALPASAGLTEYTISFYMTAEANSSGNTVVFGNFYYLMLYSSYLMIQQSAINYTDELNVIGKRTHVTLSITNSTAEIYLDGRLSATASLTSAAQGGVVNIGGVPSGAGVTFPFIGILDNLRLTNRTVTAAEAMQLSNEVR